MTPWIPAIQFGEPRHSTGERPGAGDEPEYHRDLDDEAYMREALALARLGESAGEVPVGAVLVHQGRILGRGHNAPISRHDPTAHAEIEALRAAALALENYRLPAATLYVTVEPCAMCAGALVNARLARLVFGCRDLRFGAVRSKFRLADSDLLNHRLEIVEGVLAADCMELVQAFFEHRR
jgi:tRNA(adenine34) deaminase